MLLVDNLQIVFERLDAGQQHSLRELMMRAGGLILVGASPSPPRQTQDYSAAFYDQFKVHYLSPLDESEMRALLIHLAESAQREDVHQRVLEHPARLTVLRQLTGGNPRTTLTLFFLYAEDFAPSVFGDLEGLLDRVTPLYKARFEELTDQQQVIASAIANHWDPVTAPVVSTLTGLPASTISAQLDRLEKIGMVERTELFGETRNGYQLAERFFNIWFLMRNASRRQRREVEFLTRFLQGFYEPEDRSRLARQLMREEHFSADRYVLSRAVAASLTEPEAAEELNRHAELTALQEEARDARAKLRELIDFDSLPPATLAFDELRKKLASLVLPNSGISPDEFARTVLGDREMFMTGKRNQLASRIEILEEHEILAILGAVQKAKEADEERYSYASVSWFSDRIATGQIRSRYDTADWNRAFVQASDKSCAQLLIDTFTPELRVTLTDASFARVACLLRPIGTDSAYDWYMWGIDVKGIYGRDTEAEMAVREAINRDPTHSSSFYFLGIVCARDRRRVDEAVAAYRKAAGLAPDDPWPWIALGDVYAEGGLTLEAESTYKKAIELDPDLSWGWIGLGNLHKSQGQYVEAEKEYREVTVRNHADEWGWYRLGDLLKDLERYDEAEAAYLTASTCDPGFVGPWEALGLLYFNSLHRPVDCVAALEKALLLDPTREWLHYTKLIVCRDVVGEVSWARSLMGALRQLPVADVTHLQEALFAAYDSKWDEVAQSLARALSLRSEYPYGSSLYWQNAAAFLLHLGYGFELVSLLEDTSASAALRPWVEAVRAHYLGDRRALQNVAPEIRTTAEALFDDIALRLQQLPDKTRRRPAPADSIKKTSKRGTKR